MKHPSLTERSIPPDAPVVLDCDGILVNTQGAWDRAYTELFAEHGIPLTPALRHSFNGMELAPLGRRLAELLAPAVPATSMGSTILRLMRDHLGDTLAPMPGAVELVRALSGRRRLAVASNAPRSVVIAHLEGFFDLTAFTAIVGGDDVAAPKPDPAVYLAACTVLGSDPSTSVAVEDSATGAASALAAGLFVVGAPSLTGGSPMPCHLSISTLKDHRLWVALGLGAEGRL